MLFQKSNILFYNFSELQDTLQERKPEMAVKNSTLQVAFFVFWFLVILLILLHSAVNYMLKHQIKHGTVISKKQDVSNFGVIPLQCTSPGVGCHPLAMSLVQVHTHVRFPHLWCT